MCSEGQCIELGRSIRCSGGCESRLRQALSRDLSEKSYPDALGRGGHKSSRPRYVYVHSSVRGPRPMPLLAPRHVHRDFHAKPNVNRLRNLPSHSVSSARWACFTFSQGCHDERHTYAKFVTHHFISVRNEPGRARRTAFCRTTRPYSRCLLSPEGCTCRLPQEAGVVGAAATFGIPLSSTRALQCVRSARKKELKSSAVVLPASPPSSAISFLISGVLNMLRIA